MVHCCNLRGAVHLCYKVINDHGLWSSCNMLRWGLQAVSSLQPLLVLAESATSSKWSRGKCLMVYSCIFVKVSVCLFTCRWLPSNWQGPLGKGMSGRAMQLKWLQGYSMQKPWQVLVKLRSRIFVRRMRSVSSLLAGPPRRDMCLSFAMRTC